MFLKTFKFFFCSQKVENPTLKSCLENSNPLFFLTASTDQKAQAEEVMSQNVAYRPTVYRTGPRPEQQTNNFKLISCET